MAAATPLSSIAGAITNPPAGGSGGTTGASIAQNFNTFLQLLTTQLKNQNPLDPLDTNQFTQQLVQFAGVEQQINMNQQLGTLVSLQKTAQSTAALGFLGSTVTVDGSTAKLAAGRAAWSFNAPRPATATVNIKTASGQIAYSGSFTVNAGNQNFVWDGRGTNGMQWPEGAYTISVTAKDPNGQDVAISTEVQGVVDSVDLTKNPPILHIGGQNFTLDQIRQVIRAGS